MGGFNLNVPLIKLNVKAPAAPIKGNTLAGGIRKVNHALFKRGRPPCKDTEKTNEKVGKSPGWCG